MQASHDKDALTRACKQRARASSIRITTLLMHLQPNDIKYKTHLLRLYQNSNLVAEKNAALRIITTSLYYTPMKSTNEKSRFENVQFATQCLFNLQNVHDGANLGAFSFDMPSSDTLLVLIFV